ncbi:MAG TPA: PhzF family phenazine biosynthesis protein [Vicinamibacterales bacterium]|jgi:trans-2,3-dihydro-3-hydroxyanthranilate isomerase|nr:PhzF family phenazine biosynthesis protein [Vicinamibacterales bacterium]
MRDYQYLHLDVFTDTPFEGNQLAVFPDGRGLEPTTMQSIAREMNYSESTFILPAENRGDVRMRIFTPYSELPMAGHPTVGSTFALAHTGKIARGRDEFVFELGVGPTPVELEWDGPVLSFAWMTQQRPQFGRSPSDLAALAGALGVEASDLADGPPPQEVSCGVPFFFARLATRRAVDAAEADRRRLISFFERHGLPELPTFIFTTEAGTPEATCYSRMFAGGFGITEDPATGGASGPLGCYLVHHGVLTPEQGRSLVSLQGRKMGRPSWIHIEIGTTAGAINRVRVGGRSVLVGEGTLRVP